MPAIAAFAYGNHSSFVIPEKAGIQFWVPDQVGDNRARTLALQSFAILFLRRNFIGDAADFFVDEIKPASVGAGAFHKIE